MDQGLIMTPFYRAFSVDCYPDANFAGLYGHENVQDRLIVCVVVPASGCFLWHLKLQEMALSTMDRLSMWLLAQLVVCHDLFPIVELIKELSQKSNGRVEYRFLL